MNREEFDKLYLGKAVHCDTEEKANEFLALADSVEYKWIWGESLIKNLHGNTMEKKPVLSLQVMVFCFPTGNI